MRRSELWAELMEMSAEERLELVQDLWDSIGPEELPPLTAEQMDELDRRLAEHHRDPTTAITWEEVKARLPSRSR